MQIKSTSIYALIVAKLCFIFFLSTYNIGIKTDKTNDTTTIYAIMVLQTYVSSDTDAMPYKGRNIPAPQEDCNNIIVWLDAGHGGVDAGTYVTLDEYGTRIYEKDIVLAIVLKAYELFAQSDAEVQVFLTRADDSYVHRHDRILLWNYTDYTIAKGDLVVSVHVDFYEGRTAQAVSGIQVNYYQNNHENTGRIDITQRELAQVLQDHLIYKTGARDRDIRGDRRFVIPTYSTMPAVIIEAGFMSNNDELSKLITAEYQMLIAMAIYYGVVEAMGFGG